MLTIHNMSGVADNSNLIYISKVLDGMEKHTVSNTLWKENEFIAEASFSIGYDSDNIFLKYFVKEENIKAVYREINDPVFKDSCVEFFIAYNDDNNYYNLEFNCLGTATVGFGAGKQNRELMPKKVIEKIKSISTIKSSESDLINWELTLQIPFEVFNHHQITTLKNTTCNVNFYKCGDELPKPHFLSWNNIISQSPNFHLPQFFGKAQFI